MSTPIWKRKRPSSKPRTKLTDEEVALARQRARANGRVYPNLVDNLWVLKRRQVNPRPSARSKRHE